MGAQPSLSLILRQPVHELWMVVVYGKFINGFVPAAGEQINRVQVLGLGWTVRSSLR
jgi:hypothetical protein